MEDWKGNIIKDGDEICFIRTKTGGYYKNAGWVVPNGDGTFTTHTIPDEPEKDCWQIGEYVKVWSRDGDLFATTKVGEYTITQQLSYYLAFKDMTRLVLAIKGVSDDNPNHK